MDVLENVLIFTEVLVSSRPKYYVYQNLTSTIVHVLLPVWIAIGNSIEEHIRSIWEHKKNKKSILPPHPIKNTSPPHCMFCWLMECMQIQYLELVVTISGLN